MDCDSYVQWNKAQQRSQKSYDQAQWQDNRPCAYETWQILATVIATGDPTAYQRTLVGL